MKQKKTLWIRGRGLSTEDLSIFLIQVLWYIFTLNYDPTVFKNMYLILYRTVF